MRKKLWIIVGTWWILPLLAAPGRPSITALELPATLPLDSRISIPWHMWWGQTGDRFEVHFGDHILYKEPLTPTSSQGVQTGTANFRLTKVGTKPLKLALCLAHLCSFSQTFKLTITKPADSVD